MKNSKRTATQIILISIMVIICIIWIVPIVFLLGLSFQTQDAYSGAEFIFFPVGENFTFDNYTEILSDSGRLPILTWLTNSLIVSCSVSLLTVLLCSLSAYAFARMKFKAKGVMFSLMMATMMVPGIISIIPNFLTVSAMGLNDSLSALIFPCLGGVANVYLMRQFLYSIPRELDESAKIDGAGNLSLFFRIIMPQMIPILVVVALNSFLGSWNDLLWPIIINSSTELNTMTSGLSMITSAYDRKYGIIAAATIISAIPVLVVFMLAQKYIIKGISATSGMKE